MPVIKELGIFQDNTWSTTPIGADASNVSLSNGTNIESALTNLYGLKKLDKSKAIITDANGVLTTSNITSTELGYLSNLTGNIQEKINTIVNNVNSANNNITNIDNKINNYITFKQTNSGDNYSAYWKFANGILICAKTIITTVSMTKSFGYMYETSSAINFGKWLCAFKQQPYITASSVNSGSGAMCIIEKIQNATSTSAGQSFLLSPASRPSVKVGIHIVGIGQAK